MKNIIILYSGGLDSSLLYEYGKVYNKNDNIKLVYLDYGNLVCKNELVRIKARGLNVEVIKLDFLHNDTQSLLFSKEEDNYKGNIYIPGRNLLFIISVALKYLPDEIWLGALSEEYHTEDKNEDFRIKTEILLNDVLKNFKHSPLKIRFPFVELNFTKITLIEWALSQNLINIIDDSYSCYNYTLNNTECGSCHQCLKKYLLNYRFNLKINQNINIFQTVWLETYLDSLFNKLEEENYPEILINDLDFESLFKLLQMQNNILYKKYFKYQTKINAIRI